MMNYEAIPLHWVNRLSFLSRKELTKRFRQNGYDISTEEWAVLLILWKKKAQTPGEIADVTFRDRTTVTRLIDGMVKKGLVIRENDPNDRRRSILRASTTGKKLEQNLVPIALALVSEATDGISAQDIQTTILTLRKMTQSLLPDPGPHYQNKLQANNKKGAPK